MKISKPLKIHGGKEYLADWIVSLAPKRCTNPNDPDPTDKGWLHLVETHAGGASVSLAMNPDGISEVWNDKNNEIINFFDVFKSQDKYGEFQRIIAFSQFSEREWRRARYRLGQCWSDVQRAAMFFVFNRQSHSGRMKDFAAVSRNRTRRGMNEQVAAWLSAVDGLADFHARIQRILLLCQDAIDCIDSQDDNRTLFYLDPPYLHSTRAAKDTYGEFEMSERAHAILLARLSNPAIGWLMGFKEFETLQGRESYHDFKRAWKAPLHGRFMLSGYRSALYDRFAKAQGWKRHERKIDNKAAGGKKKRIMTECVWTNY